MKTLTLLTLLIGNSLSLAAHADVITLQEIQSYQSKGYSVSVGEVYFDAGPSHLQIPGTSVCNDGTNLRAGSITMCEAPNLEGSEFGPCASPYQSYTVKYDLVAPIVYKEVMTTPEGGANEPCPANGQVARDGSCILTKKRYLGVAVQVGNNYGGGASEGGPASDVRNSVYNFPACAK